MHVATLKRIVQRSADHDMDLQHGLGRERAAPVGWAEFGLVELFDVFGPQPPDGQRSEIGKDAAVHDPLIAVPSRRPELDALGRQPGLGQERTEAQPAATVIGASEFAGESTSEHLCGRLVGAGCVPSPMSRPVTGSSPS